MFSITPAWNFTASVLLFSWFYHFITMQYSSECHDPQDMLPDITTGIDPRLSIPHPSLSGDHSSPGQCSQHSLLTQWPAPGVWAQQPGPRWCRPSCPQSRVRWPGCSGPGSLLLQVIQCWLVRWGTDPRWPGQETLLVTSSLSWLLTKVLRDSMVSSTLTGWSPMFLAVAMLWMVQRWWDTWSHSSPVLMIQSIPCWSWCINNNLVESSLKNISEAAVLQ